MCCLSLKDVNYCSQTKTGIKFTIKSINDSDNQVEYIEVVGILKM